MTPRSPIAVGQAVRPATPPSDPEVPVTRPIHPSDPPATRPTPSSHSLGPTRPGPAPDWPHPPPAGPAPGAGDGLARWLCHCVPEFTPAYLALVDGCGDDPGEPVVLMELAELVSATLATLDDRRRLLQRALDAVEDVLAALGDDTIGCELVAFAFFDSLSPEERSRLLPSLRPRARELSLALDLPDADWEVLS